MFAQIYGLGDGRPQELVRLGLAHSHVLDVVLALSACHLRHHVVSSSANRIAEHYYQGQAIHGFQSALGQALNQQSADALLLTAMMLNLLSFPLTGIGEDAEPEASWVFRTDDQRCSWMSLNMGLKSLLTATRAFRQDSLMRWVYEASDDEANNSSVSELLLGDVPASWRTFFNFESDQASKNNLFYEPVRILALLRRLPPSPDACLLYVSFFGKLDAAFRKQVEGQDPRAIWLLGFWFGLLRRYDFWWMRDRVKRDHQAVILWFKSCGTAAREKYGKDVARQLLHDLMEAPYLKDTPNISAL
ncbi:hypothetical protein HJFPF1_08055 [Paramyrothecium foliicola]|nr:hypothetical protein HJFPF1_08055 [Paramyrothecium foliicola]